MFLVGLSYLKIYWFIIVFLPCLGQDSVFFENYDYGVFSVRYNFVIFV